MGSKRTLRHKYGIRSLSSHMHRLFCLLSRAVSHISRLSIYDIGILDAWDWNSLLKEDMTLPETITMEAATILFTVHGRIWDIVDAYAGPLLEPPYLFDFFRELICLEIGDTK